MAWRFVAYRAVKFGPLINFNQRGFLSCLSQKHIATRLKHDLAFSSINKNFLMVTKKLPDQTICPPSDSKPLVVMFPWLLARQKHVKKYYDIYISRGYDVLSVSITPWQFFWPLSGSQVVAERLIDYLNKCSRDKLVIHGFSVGAYLWGECLVKFNADLPKYSDLITRIKGQVFDSSADITETSKGLPQAMFPRNPFLRSTMEKYVNYHLRAFYDTATQHYLRASQLYHTTPVRAPALVFVSQNDPIGSIIANTKAKESWESMGMKVHWKCWEKSRHVSHLMLHRDEYISTLNLFLDEIEANHVNNLKDKISQ
ncbi:hypothetical protein O3M35_004288 [Rhynocoris fuscipes]|uniref:Transmembrane protein 53 n=1 Tax=Rhynocoris fuscipes TaxID=488301 RepID=A0AAW1CMW8_9HEMI